MKLLTISVFKKPERHYFAILGVLIWLIPFVVIAFIVAIKPLGHEVTHIYHKASCNWWAGKDIYHGPGGLNYLPHFVLVFSPFHSMPFPAGDIVWRFCAAVLLATGLRRLLQEHFERNELAQALLYASLITTPLCLGALRNGQANALFAALTLHAVACLPRRQWWAAAALMTLSLAVKPLGIVLILLSSVVYAPLRLRLALALIALAVFPFLFAPPEYIIAQYRGFIVDIQSCALLTTHRFADIAGVIRTFGGELPPLTSILIRAAAGVITLGLWCLGARRLREQFVALWLLTLTAGYLMLFNPMNESNSYVILAPAFGLWAVVQLREPSTCWSGLLTASISLSMSLLPNLLHPLFGNYFALFWDPVMTTTFIGLLIYWLLHSDSPSLRRSRHPLHPGYNAQ